MGSRIRVRFSGLVLFAGNILSFLLGFIFIVLVSRNLSQGDLGAWFFIGSLLTYFEVLEKAVPYWTLRDSARGVKISKTSAVAGAILSIPFMIGYAASSFIVSEVAGVGLTLFLIAGLLIPIYYASAPMTSVIYARYPHLAGLRNPIIDGVKIPLAVLLLPYGLGGVIFAVVVANLVYLIYALIIVRREFEEKLNFSWLRKRIRHMWLPLLRSASNYISSASDTFFVGALLSPVQLSYYGIGMTVSNAVKASRQFSLPFSVKVLSQEKTTKSEVRSMLKFLSIFVIPMLVGGIILAPNLYGIFGQTYVKGAWILPPLLLASVFTSYSAILRGLLKGLEKADKDLEVGYGRLLRSMLFITDAVDYLFTGILVISSLILIPLIGMIGAALSRLAASITSFTIFVYMSFRHLSLRDHLVDLEKILAACIPMAGFLLLFKSSGTLMTLLSIVIGGSIFFAALYAIDEESRSLIKIVFNELSNKLLTFLE